MRDNCKDFSQTRLMAMKVFGMPLVVIILAFCVTVDSYAVNKLNDQIMSENEVLSFPHFSRHRRALPLSMNNGLRSLARMLFSHQQRRSWSAAARNHKKLHLLGKRNQGFDSEGLAQGQNGYYIDEITGNDDNNNGAMIKDGFEKAKNKFDVEKRQRLSVNGAMATFAEMLAASGQRRLREELESNKQKLLGLGK